MWVLPSFTDLRSGRVHSNPAALLAGATNLGLERMARASSGVSHGQFREGLVIDSAGSSPRVRGTGRQYPYWPSSLAVHPRACGERSSLSRAMPLGIGSSPRVRGTVGRRPSSLVRIRFIPARAGNGAVSHCGEARSPVHPRACGERSPTSTSTRPANGSSPRVRGTARGRPSLRPEERFIPARAGNGRTQSRLPLHPTVHPRACGERATARRVCSKRAGSSPRVRGTDSVVPLISDDERFIPARAGNGSTPSAIRRCRTVHPRACGERSLVQLCAPETGGSSPRVRGTASYPKASCDRKRFIPARAGNGPD